MLVLTETISNLNINDDWIYIYLPGHIQRIKISLVDVTWAGRDEATKTWWEINHLPTCVCE